MNKIIVNENPTLFSQCSLL